MCTVINLFDSENNVFRTGTAHSENSVFSILKLKKKKKIRSQRGKLELVCLSNLAPKVKTMNNFIHLHRHGLINLASSDSKSLVIIF
jgi:hypothetical protein